MKFRHLITSLWAASALSLTAADPLDAYPPAEEGMTRHVLPLPKEEDESILKVELIVGKIVEIDVQNTYFFGGALEKKTIEGWGYSYHLLPKMGPMAGTLMAVPPDTPKAERFIHVGGEPYLVRYNSKVPVVVYAPEGVEVRYRIWRGDAEMLPVEEG